MTHLFDIPYLLITYGYAGIFIIIFLESSILPPLPGDSLLFSAGLFASLSGFNIYFLICLIFLATFLGGLIGYEVGFYFLKLRNYFLFRNILTEANLQKAHRFFEKYGKVSVIFARFVPFMRTFIPIVAGVAKMHYPSFVKWSTLGAILWSGVVTLLGYFLGRIFPGIKDYLGILLIVVVLLSVIPVLIEIFRNRMKKSS